MVMPSSGPISMAQAHAEFGLGNNIKAYYGCDVGVPTSGAISLAHLYGKRKVPAFAFIKIYNITNPSFSAATKHNFYEIELRNVAGGANFASSCVDNTPFDGGSGRQALVDRNLSSYAGFGQGTGKGFLIFQLSQAIAIRELAMYGYSASVGATSFSVGGANTLAELQSGNGTLLANINGVSGMSVGAWRTIAL